jgi:nitroreductase
MAFDLAQTDHLLSTTRAVRKRLDFDRPVEREVLLECLRLAVQAPTGSNAQGWRWVFVTDADKRHALADMYRAAGSGYLTSARDAGTGDTQTDRVIGSALFLAENLERAPVFLIPCIVGRLDEARPVLAASFYGSILPAVWSFQLALRSRGLGSTFTTLHLAFEKRAGELLGIPREVSQVGLLPIAYTKGTDFSPAQRGPVEAITYWNSFDASSLDTPS